MVLGGVWRRLGFGLLRQETAGDRTNKEISQKNDHRRRSLVTIASYFTRSRLKISSASASVMARPARIVSGRAAEVGPTPVVETPTLSL